MASLPRSDWSLYRRLAAEAAPFRLHVLAIIILQLLATPISLLTPLPLKIVVDTVLGPEPLPGFIEAISPAWTWHSEYWQLIVAVILMLLVSLLNYVRSMADWLTQAYTGERLVLSVRAKLFRHLQRLSLVYHDTRGTTDSVYRLQWDAMGIQHLVTNGFIALISSSFTVIAVVIVTAMINWRLAMVAAAVVPVLFILTYTCRWLLRKRWFAVKEMESVAMQLVQETLSSLRVVKAFGREDHERARFVEQSSKVIRGHLGVAGIESGFDLLVGMTVAIGTAAVLVIGVTLVLDDSITIGALLMVMAYIAQLFGPLETISKKIAEVQSSLAGAQRVFDVLDEQADVTERPDALPLLRAKGAIAFEGVDFSYDRRLPVLEGVSVRVPAATRVGILGHTGAGKSTLISLLFRFFDPTRGRILLDGHDLRDYRLADLRAQYAVVLQEAVLFSASIRENIAYARPGAREEEIVAAATAANAHDFIMALPDGYATTVGERGSRLSGGERQRISIARAFLKDAPILVLDEPTSAVDSATESVIIAAIDRLMVGRTTFMIAHRLSTLRDCDMWLQLDHGRLVEIGTTPPRGVEAAARAEGLAMGAR
ncbi:MAG: ABC transporter ATP-binding protein [Alphaproteobacteria bacterium]|nr:ABC transporter ATP-binding protein [Alphaproteobacteria bacterium]